MTLLKSLKALQKTSKNIEIVNGEIPIYMVKQKHY